MLNAMLSRGRSGGAAPAPKRQRRADILDDICGGGGGSGSSRGGSLGSGIRLPVGGKSAAAPRTFTAASATASAPAAHAKESKVTETHAPTWQLKTSSKALGEVTAPASSKEAEDDILPETQAPTLEGHNAQAAVVSSPAEVRNGASADSVARGEAEVRSVDEEAGCSDASEVQGARQDESSTPALIVNPKDLDKGWRARFAKAKDTWDVDDDGMRSLFWHSKTGCCFEWDQSAGMLFQYSEDRQSPAELPRRVPIWTTACPNSHNWIWEQLPLPPTDPASTMEEQDDEENKEHIEGGEDSAASGGEDSAASTSASQSSSANGFATANEEPSAAPLLIKDAANSGVFAIDRPAASSEEPGISKAVSSDDATCMPPPVGLPVKSKKKKGAESTASAQAAGGSQSSSSKSGASSDQDADILEEPSWLGEVFDEEPLGVGEETVALPAAPAECAQPQACDLDLDMFGEPV